MADWSPVCPNCGAVSQQDVAEELNLFYDEDEVLHVHGFPSEVTCGKCRWEYGFEYTCPPCFEKAEEVEADAESDAKAPKKGHKKSRKGS